MIRSISELASLTGATLYGRGDVRPSGLAVPQRAVEGDVICLFRPKQLESIRDLSGVTVVTGPDCRTRVEALGPVAVLVCDNPLVAFARLIDVFYPEPLHVAAIHPRAVVEDGAVLGADVSVGPNAVIESGAQIGEGCRIAAGAVICGCVRMGRFVRIGPNAVIGYEGFGQIPLADGIRRIRHVGGVVIGDGVDIGACCCVDRGTLGDTIIGEGTCIDNLVQVGHNVSIGKDVLIAAQSGIAGSTRIADRVRIGGQAGIADHLEVGENAMVAAKSGVIGNVVSGATVAGYPAMDRWQWLRMMARMKRES